MIPGEARIGDYVYHVFTRQKFVIIDITIIGKKQTGALEKEFHLMETESGSNKAIPGSNKILKEHSLCYFFMSQDAFNDSEIKMRQYKPQDLQETLKQLDDYSRKERILLTSVLVVYGCLILFCLFTIFSLMVHS